MKLTIDVPDITLRGLLTTAVESGVLHYWAAVSKPTRDADGYVTRVKITEHEAADEHTIRANRYITPEDLGHAIEKLAALAVDDQSSAARHVAAALADHDAGTADVLVQMAVFGRIIYS